MENLACLDVVCKTMKFNRPTVGRVMTNWLYENSKNDKFYCCNVSCKEGFSKPVPLIEHEDFKSCEHCFGRIAFKRCLNYKYQMPVPFDLVDVVKFINEHDNSKRQVEKSKPSAPNLEDDPQPDSPKPPSKRARLVKGTTSSSTLEEPDLVEEFTLHKKPKNKDN